MGQGALAVLDELEEKVASEGHLGAIVAWPGRVEVVCTPSSLEGSTGRERERERERDIHTHQTRRLSETPTRRSKINRTKQNNTDRQTAHLTGDMARAV